MIISGVQIYGNSNGGDLSAYETAARDFNAYNLVLVAMTVAYAGGAPDPDVSGGTAGLALTEIGQSPLCGVSPQRNIRLYRAMPTTNLNGTIKFDWGSNIMAGWLCHIAQFDNVKKTGSNGADAIRQVVVGSVITGTGVSVVNMAAFGHVDNACYAAFFQIAHTSVTPGTNFTQLGLIQTHASPNAQQLMHEWRNANDIAPTCTWGSTSDNVGIAVELVADQVVDSDGLLTLGAG